MADPESSFVLADSVSHLLHRSLQLAEERFTRLAAKNGITLRQFAVLAAIDDEPGLSQAKLVRATGIDRSTLADMMARMESRGLIVRTRAEDQRANSVRLTPAGAILLQASVNQARAADAAILDLLSASKRKSLLGTLTRLAERADKAAEKEDRAERKRQKREKAAQANAAGDKKPKRRKRDKHRQRAATAKAPADETVSQKS